MFYVNKVNRFLAILVVLLPLTTAKGNPVETLSGRVGNGGYAYVCRSATGAITFARLLDLWEAEGLDTHVSSDPVAAQIDAAIAKIRAYSPNAATIVAHNLGTLEKSVIRSKRRLEATDDAFPAYRPDAGCGYEQVARYEPVLTESGKAGLRIASEIFDSEYFSNTDRAALFVHEAVYFADREANEAENSQRSRMIVAHLFSHSEIPNPVRLATATLLGVKIHSPIADTADEEKVAQNIIAVTNPLAIELEVRFSEVDGLNYENIARRSEAKKRARYRCTGASNPSDKYESTTWVTAEALVGTHPFLYPRPTTGAKISATIIAQEFIPRDMPPGATMETRVVIRCERRDTDGKVRSVGFKSAMVKIDDAIDLTVLQDGSLQTGDRPRPVERSLSSRNNAYGGGHWSILSLAIVRATN